MSQTSSQKTSLPPPRASSAIPSESGSVRGNNNISASAACPSFATARSNYRELRRERLADGPACVLAVGTANPVNCIKQDEYTDWYFHLTKSDHLTDMKDAMKRICEMTGIKKRYWQMSEDLLQEHPEFLDPAAPSLPARLAVVAAAMPGIAAAAAVKAIAEWGRPAADITHLVFSTSASAQIPAIDLQIASLLGLRDTVKRSTISFHGCTGTSSALRIGKDVAENNSVARVLVICSDMLSINGFHIPDEAHPTGIIGHALFGDGAGAVIVGAEPLKHMERPIYEMVSTSQVTVPGTEHVATTEFTADGIGYSLYPHDLAALVDRNIERCLDEALAPHGIGKLGWNNLFWVVHPGGPVIMDSLAAALRLEPNKLAASRRVLSEYGNMSGPTLIFVLDEVIRRHWQQDGEKEWGVMVGFGPGFTIEVMALRACTSKSTWGPKSAL